MSIPGASSRTFSTSSLFAAFSLTLIGWGLIHRWGFGMKIGLLAHAIAAVPGLVLSGAVIYRYRRHWPVKTMGMGSAGKHDRKPSWEYRAMAFYPLLTGAGFGIALSINGGHLSVLLLAALGMLAVPWAKISVCRDHFFLASVSVQSGALAGLGVLAGPAHPLHVPVAAWLLLGFACILLLSVIGIHGNRLDRMPDSGYQEATPSSV